MKLYGSLTPPAPPRHRRGFINGTPRAGASGFGMASTSRLFADWSAGTITNDSLLASQLVPMRNRARQLARDEDYMKAFLIAVRNNVIGPNGVTLQMDVRNPARKTAEGEWETPPDDLANDAIEAAYDMASKRWTMDRQGNRVPAFTTSGKYSRTEFAHLGMTTTARDGEFFWRVIRGFDNPGGFAIQPINPDFVDECKNEVRPNGDEVRMGVQRNSWGRVTGFWLRTWNPGDTFWTGRSAGSYKSDFVSSEDIRHFYVPDDFDLSRGYPWIHAGATRLKMLSGYEEGALEASRAAACKHEYFKRINDPTAPVADFTGDATDEFGNLLSDVEPGTREKLPDGYDVVSIDPKYPHTEHGGFITATLGGICAGLGLSRLTLTGDLSQANYSSMRAGLLPERDQWMLLQSLWILGVELPNFLDWLRFALLKGAIKLPNGVALPADRFDKFAQPVFQGRRWPWVDPMKDQEANALALAQRVTTRTSIVAQQGSDLDEVFRTLEREKRIAAKRGLTFPEDVAALAAIAGAKAAVTAGNKPKPEDAKNPEAEK